MKLYHGAHTAYTVHIGQCYTDDKDCAKAYADGGQLATVEINTDGLSVVEVAAYDRDEDFAYGDDRRNPIGCDVAVYDDEDIHGNALVTYRLMTAAALAAVTVAKIKEQS